MAKNVEIKARVSDPHTLREVAAKLADGPPEVLQQEDVFFPTARGRLKLRRFADGEGELIFYERPDESGPKLSSYAIHPTDDPDGLRGMLTEALGTAGVVRKVRTLFLVGQTRVHLDEVEGLGSFLELEVVLDQDQDAEDGRRIALDLMERLGVQSSMLVEGAYVDLLETAGDEKAGEKGRQGC